MESGLLDTEIPEISATDSHERINAALGASFSTQQQTFNRFSRYEANLSRAYDRTLKQLLAIRKAGLQPVQSGPFGYQTNPSRIENKQPLPTPAPYEPNIRTINDPPAAPQDTTNRRHGQFTPFPEPPPRIVDLVWIREDENGNEISQKW